MSLFSIDVCWKLYYITITVQLESSLTVFSSVSVSDLKGQGSGVLAGLWSACCGGPQGRLRMLCEWSHAACSCFGLAFFTRQNVVAMAVVPPFCSLGCCYCWELTNPQRDRPACFSLTVWAASGWFPVCCSVAQSCLTLCDPMDCSMPGSPILHYLPELAQTHVHWVHPTISSSVTPFSSWPQSFPASGSFPTSRLFTSGGQSTGASASPSVILSNEYSGLTSFMMDWLDLLAVQGSLKSLLQHHSLKLGVFCRFIGILHVENHVIWKQVQFCFFVICVPCISLPCPMAPLRMVTQGTVLASFLIRLGRVLVSHHSVQWQL